MPVPVIPAIPDGIGQRRRTRVYDDPIPGLNVFLQDVLDYIASPYVTLTEVGAIQATINPTPPDGWLVMDGSTFDAAVYPDLAALLGGNVLPDYSNRYLKGGAAIGVFGGNANVTLTAANLPTHTHDVTTNDHTHTFTSDLHQHTINEPGGQTTDDVPGGPVNAGVQPGITSDEVVTGTTDAGGGETLTTTATGGGAPFAVDPPHVTVFFIIFAGAA